MSSVKKPAAGQAIKEIMEVDLDVDEIARWAIAIYGPAAVAVIRRRAAENLLADEVETAECWKQVAEAAGQFLAGRR